MTGITITPIPHKVFGATLTGVSLRDLSDAQFATLHSAFLTYGFLVFPGQFLTDAENIAFGKRFGELEFGAMPLSNQERRADGTWGEIFEVNSRRMRSAIGNEGWHTDSTYKPLSSKCAMLSAVVLSTKAVVCVKPLPSSTPKSRKTLPPTSRACASSTLMEKFSISVRVHLQ